MSRSAGVARRVVQGAPRDTVFLPNRQAASDMAPRAPSPAYSAKTLTRRLPFHLLSILFMLAGSSLSHGGPQWREVLVRAMNDECPAVHSFALGADGTPWQVFDMPDPSIRYFDGEQWRPVPISGFKRPQNGYGLGHLFLSPDGTLYCALVHEYIGKPPREGILLRLTRTEASVVTKFTYDDHYKLSLYADKSGRIWSWTPKSLSKFEHGQWTDHQAEFGRLQGKSCVSVIELDKDNIYFISFDPGCTFINYVRNGVFGSKRLLGPDPQRQSAPPHGASNLPIALQWTGHNAVILSAMWRGMPLLNLDKLEPERPAYEAIMPQGSLPRGAIRDGSGNIWVLLDPVRVSWNFDTDDPRYKPVPAPGCLKLDARTGKLTVVQGPEVIQWFGDHAMEELRTALVASDGSFVIGTQWQGVGIYKDRRFRLYDWRDGVRSQQIQCALEAPDHRIWFASHDGVLVYDPKGEPAPANREWSEFETVNNSVVRDKDFNLWMFLKQEHGCVSRFDGISWRHLKFTEESRRDLNILSDNLGSIYLCHDTLAQGGWRLDCTGRAKKFEDVRDMVAAAVGEGVTSFRASFNICGPVVAPNKEIWFSYYDQKMVNHYDGTQWRTLIVQSYTGVEQLFAWGAPPVLARYETRLFLRPDGDKLVPLSAAPGLQLIGENGLEPFEEPLRPADADQLLPARIDGGYLAVGDSIRPPAGSSDKDPSLDVVKAILGSFDPINIRLSPYGGSRVGSRDPHTANDIIRSWNGLHLRFGTAETPMRNCPVKDFYEAAGGSLCFRFDYPAREDNVFIVRRPKMETTITRRPEKVVASPRVRIEFTGTADSQPSEAISYAWRLNGGRWSEPDPKTFAEFEAHTSGKYVFEVTAIGKYASLDPTPAKAEFEVRPGHDQAVPDALRPFYSNDYADREKAVAESVKTGPSCLPALKKALKGAPPDAAWWIRSAIEQIEAKQKQP